MFENMPVDRGPERWKLGESILSYDEIAESRPPVEFRVLLGGKLGFLTVWVANLGVQHPDLKDSFRIDGVGQLRMKDADRNEYVFRNTPVYISFNVRDRTGMAQVKF